MSEISKKLVVSSDLEKNLIFQSLLRMKEPIELELGGFHYPGFVKRYDRESILLDMQTPLKMDVGGPVRAHFVFHNSYHYFDTAAQKKDDNHIQLLLPEKINRNILRANERIPSPKCRSSSASSLYSSGCPTGIKYSGSCSGGRSRTACTFSS